MVVRQGDRVPDDEGLGREEPKCWALDDVRRRLPPDGCVRFLARHNMAAPFDPRELSELREYCRLCGSGRVSFRDRDLERRSQALLRCSQKFLESVDDLVVPGRVGMVAVPRAWMQEDPTRFDRAVYRLNKLSEKVLRAYDALVDHAGLGLTESGAGTSGED